MIKDKLVDCLKENNVKGSFIIKNLKTQEAWLYNETEIVPSASLIKLFILIKAFEEIRDKGIDLDTEIQVDKKDIVPFSVLEFLKPRKYTLEEMLNLMIVYSDNTATNVLIDYFGITAINRTIKELKFNDSMLQRKMMDFDAAKEGKENFTSAKDMAKILESLYNNQLLGAPYDSQMLTIMKGQADETMMRNDLPDEIVIARKSGELDNLDHDVAIVYTEKLDYIYVFFSWGAESNNQAREILAQTSKMVFDYYLAK